MGFHLGAIRVLEALITITAMASPMAMPAGVGQTALPIPVLIAVAAVPPPLPILRRITETLVALVRGALARALAPAPSAALVKVESNAVPLHVDSPALEEAASAVDAASAVEAECEAAEAVAAIANT